MITIDCCGDLHGFQPSLPGGDLLIVCGDLMARDTHLEYQKFFSWLRDQKYKRKIFIGGNHDNRLTDFYCTPEELMDFEYLCDSGTEYEGLKIWGVPYSLLFDGINPKCAAFTGSEEFLKSKYDLIPNDIDILISHSPAYGILDENVEGEHCGSKSLLAAIQRINPTLVIHGHIHEQGHKIKRVLL